MENETPTKEIDLMDYWRVIVRRKWLAITFACAVVLFAGIFTFTATPLYKSVVTLMVEDESSRLLSMEEAFGYEPRMVQDLRTFNTQLRLLQSKSLAERVAKRLNLTSRPELSAGRKSKMSLVAGIKYILTFKWVSAKKGAAEPKPAGLPASDPYSGVAYMILGGIEVTPIRDTKLVQVSFTSLSPTLATEIVNKLTEEFINFSIEKRSSSTQQASDFLTEQIALARDEIAAKERELQRYGQEKDIMFLSETESATVSTFARMSEAYDQAVLEKINAEAEYRELTNLESGVLPHFISDPAIQQLKTEYTALRADYEEKGRQLKLEHPEIVRIKNRLESLKIEIGKAADAASTKVKASQEKMWTIKAQLERQKADVAKMKNNAILYNSIKSEIESKIKMLNSLLEKQSETQLSAQLRGLNASNISIIDPAEVPRNPFSPNKQMNLLMSLLIGLFGGVGLCFLLEYLDDTIKGPEDVQKLTGLPSLGVIPYLPPEGLSKSKKYGAYLRFKYSYGQERTEREHTLPEVKEIELINHLYPDLPLSEDYRTVRTSILLSHAESPPKIIVFTSALTQEGKTATLVNMAVSFSQLHERVLVIEADLRKPRLHRLFKARNIAGLTGYLTGKTLLKDIIHKTFIDNIWLIPSGPIPPNPVELLNSKKMKDMLEELSQIFDVVLLDSPPVLAVIDTVVISSIAESTIFVVRSGKTRRKAFRTAVDELTGARANIIGVVFNGADLSKEGDYYSKYYRSYKYAPYKREDKNIEPEAL